MLTIYQEESITVRQGRSATSGPGEPPRFAGPARRSSSRRGRRTGSGTLGRRISWAQASSDRADNLEYFLTAIYASQRENGGGRPDPFEAAFLMRRYRSEFQMSEIPAAVQRFVFPAQVALGRLLGKYKKYADAPEPVRR